MHKSCWQLVAVVLITEQQHRANSTSAHTKQKRIERRRKNGRETNHKKMIHLVNGFANSAKTNADYDFSLVSSTNHCIQCTYTFGSLESDWELLALFNSKQQQKLWRSIRRTTCSFTCLHLHFDRMSECGVFSNWKRHRAANDVMCINFAFSAEDSGPRLGSSSAAQASSIVPFVR